MGLFWRLKCAPVLLGSDSSCLTGDEGDLVGESELGEALRWCKAGW